MVYVELVADVRFVFNAQLPKHAATFFICTNKILGQELREVMFQQARVRVTLTPAHFQALAGPGLPRNESTEQLLFQAKVQLAERQELTQPLINFRRLHLELDDLPQHDEHTIALMASFFIDDMSAAYRRQTQPHASRDVIITETRDALWTWTKFHNVKTMMYIFLLGNYMSLEQVSKFAKYLDYAGKTLDEWKAAEAETATQT